MKRLSDTPRSTFKENRRLNSDTEEEEEEEEEALDTKRVVSFFSVQRLRAEAFFILEKRKSF